MTETDKQLRRGIYLRVLIALPIGALVYLCTSVIIDTAIEIYEESIIEEEKTLTVKTELVADYLDVRPADVILEGDPDEELTFFYTSKGNIIASFHGRRADDLEIEKVVQQD